MSQSKEIDRFEKNLEMKLQELKKCQRQKGVESCMECEKILKCEIRKEYVNAVYLSMNKGEGGGFEF